MSNYNSRLQSNNFNLKEILDTINELPIIEGSGGDTSDSTINLDDVLTQQEELLAELQTALENKTADLSAVEEDIIKRTIITYTNDKITLIGNYGFCYCDSLISVDLPEVIKIGVSGFSTCSALTEIVLPKVITLGSTCFNSCSKLESVKIPLARSLGSQCFRNCTSLQSLTLPSHCYISSRCFEGCKKLVSLTLSSNSLYILDNTEAFSNSGITTTTGAIYVPSSLVNSYKAANNWSNFADRIFAIEEA